MKCPKCKFSIPLLGNSKEEMGVTVLECPECGTSFELHSMKKMFPKGVILMALTFIPLSLLPLPIAAVILVIAGIPFYRWVFRPENISFGNRNAKNT